MSGPTARNWSGPKLLGLIFDSANIKKIHETLETGPTADSRWPDHCPIVRDENNNLLQLFP